MSIALKEANETEYWLRLLFRTNYLCEAHFRSMEADIHSIISLLIAICRSADENT